MGPSVSINVIVEMYWGVVLMDLGRIDGRGWTLKCFLVYTNHLMYTNYIFHAFITVLRPR